MIVPISGYPLGSVASKHIESIISKLLLDMQDFPQLFISQLKFLIMIIKGFSIKMDARCQITYMYTYICIHKISKMFHNH